MQTQPFTPSATKSMLFVAAVIIGAAVLGLLGLISAGLLP